MSAIKNIFNRLLALARKTRLAKVLTMALLAAILFSAVFTYVIITNPHLFEFGDDASFESNLLIVNLGLLLMFFLLISRKLIKLWIASERGNVGSRLLLKLVLMFSLVAIIPAIVVGVSSSFYLNLGIKSWFDERVNSAIEESVEVANAYLEEHKKVIQADALNLANDISNNSLSFGFDIEKLNAYLTRQSTNRLLAEAIILQKDRVIASSRLGILIDPLSQIEPEFFDLVQDGDVVISSEGDEKVSALVRIGNYTDSYLWVSRYIDPKVVNHTRQAKGAAAEYVKLKRQIVDFQVRSTIFFVMIALFLLLGAVWVAFRFANNIVQPVTNLVAATERIKKGEFAVRVKEGPQNDEIATLSRSFNQMAAELESQKRGVIIANREAGEKRKFAEDVLSGITSGVIVVDENKKIALLNEGAKELLSLGDNTVGKSLKDVVPEFFELFDDIEYQEIKELKKQVTIRRKTKRMTYNVRINPHTEKGIDGFIMTFDDITELLSAQRSSAWSDVARKIAHEIKNPLTPINLSAQRLAKKYPKLLPEDEREDFEGYTNTITRHTADIAKIIGEFSTFARLPAPKFVKTDLAPILKDTVFSSKVASSKIEYHLDMPDKIETVIDPGQITQVLMNVIKNASESVKENRKKGGKVKAKAVVDENIVITIEDNGGGFPEELLDRITEPYVTTRQKGTGLGLAIVKKIMEDHNGSIELGNISKGAQVKLTLPVIEA